MSLLQARLSRPLHKALNRVSSLSLLLTVVRFLGAVSRQQLAWGAESCLVASHWLTWVTNWNTYPLCGVSVASPPIHQYVEPRDVSTCIFLGMEI